MLIAWLEFSRSTRRLVRHPLRLLTYSSILGLAVALVIAAWAFYRALEHTVARFPDARNLAVIWRQAGETDRSFFSHPEAADWQEAAIGLSAITTLEPVALKDVSSDRHAERVGTVTVATNYFDVLGARPKAGRGFLATDGDASSTDVVVLTNSLASRLFDSSASAVGRIVRMEGRAGLSPHQVVGVVGDEVQLRGWPAHALYAPRKIETVDRASSARRALDCLLIARTDGTVAPIDLEDRLGNFARSLVERYPNSPPASGVAVVSLREFEFDGYGSLIRLFTLVSMATVFVAVLSLLAVALLQHGQRIAERVTMLVCGQPPTAPLIRTLAESLVVAAVSFIFGVPALGLVLWAVRERLGSLDPMSGALRLDGTLVLALVSGAALIFALVSGSVGVIRYIDRVIASRSRTRLQTKDVLVGVLTVALIAITLPLAAILRHYAGVVATPLGFDGSRVAVLGMLIPRAQRQDAGHYSQLITQVQQDLSTVAGVEGVAIASHLPAGTEPIAPTIAVTVSGQRQRALYRTVSPSYFSVLSVPVNGRVGTTDGVCEIAINASFARTFLEGQSIGSVVQINGADCSVTAVVGDVREHDASKPPRPAIYAPPRSGRLPTFLWVLVRGHDGIPDPGALRGALSRAVPGLAPSMTDFPTVLARQRAPARFALVTLAISAVYVMLLALLASVTVTTLSLRERAWELTMRQALGEPPIRTVVRTTGRTLVAIVLASVPGVLLGSVLIRMLSSLIVIDSRVPQMWVIAIVGVLWTAIGASTLFPLIRGIRGRASYSLLRSEGRSFAAR